MNLGSYPNTSDQKDAIHIAIVPLIAHENLSPGQHVGISSCKQKTSEEVPYIGIVDPFLQNNVMEGDRVWVCLYPNTITSLRHDWLHPAFSNKEKSEEWMEEFAAQHGEYPNYPDCSEYVEFTASDIIEMATDFIKYGEWYVQKGSESLRDGDYSTVEFWHHFEVITGIKVTDYNRDHRPFSCTC